jgi:hypothetical protein
MRRVLCALLAITAATAVHAQMVKSDRVASNGLVVSVNRDDFAERYEYTAPTIRFKDGFALVAAIKKNGRARGPYIMGSLMYSDRSWRNYDQAILRGGEKVEAVFGDRDVVSCRGSRYSGCTYSEGFQLTLNLDRRKRLAEAGSIDVQLKGIPGSEVILTVPASYFLAVEEVSGS